MPSNGLIEQLPAGSRRRLLNLCETVELQAGTILNHGTEPLQSVYFPCHGMLSLAAIMEGRASLGIGMVGREGMIGAQLAVGVLDGLHHIEVYTPGSALRVDSTSFNDELQHNDPLRKIAGRYLCLTYSQLSLSAACLNSHRIGPRLARWMLMIQDRARASHFQVTHQSLAVSLGVRRVGVTTAAVALQQQGILAYHRGSVRVLNRRALMGIACSCYAADKKSFASFVRQSSAAR